MMMRSAARALWTPSLISNRSSSRRVRQLRALSAKSGDADNEKGKPVAATTTTSSSNNSKPGATNLGTVVGASISEPVERGSAGSGTAAESEWGFAAGADNVEQRVLAAKKIQTLVREGYDSLDPQFYIAAADSVSRLPSGSLARRYLSGFIMNGHGNLVAATAGNNAQAGELLKGAFEHAVSEASEGLGDDRYSDIVSFASDLAINHAANGRLPAAEKLLKRALYWVTSSRVEPDRPLIVATLTNLGQVQLLQGRSSAALDTQERALVESANLFGADNLLVRAALLTNLASALRLEDIGDRALRVAGDAVTSARASLTQARELQAHGAVAPAAQTLAAALVNKGVHLVTAPDCSREDVARAAALAAEALELEYAPRGPGLLLAGLCADAESDSIALFERAEREAEAPTAARAAAHNAQALARAKLQGTEEEEEELCSEEELEAEAAAEATRVIGRLPAARQMLYRVSLGANAPGAFLWVQGQSAFVNGLTLRAFCRHKAAEEAEAEDNKKVSHSA